MDKTQQLSSGDHPTASENPFNEGLPSGEKLPPSLSSLVPSVDDDSGLTDELCQAIGRLCAVDIKKTQAESLIGIDKEDEFPRWDALSGPPLDRLLFHLKKDGDLKDLYNFAMVSPYFRSEAKLFMKSAENRPGIKKLTLRPHFRTSGSFLVEICLFQSNISFHDFTDLDWERFERVRKLVEFKDSPVLRVVLNGIEDPIIEQVVNLLSTTIQSVDLSAYSFNSFSMGAQLLRMSTIGALNFKSAIINDTTARGMLSIVSRLKPGANRLEVDLYGNTGLSDPESFIISLLSGVTSVHLQCIFGNLPNAFWEKYLNAKLTSGAVGWVRLGWVEDNITKAPVNIDPNERIYHVKWGQADEE